MSAPKSDSTAGDKPRRILEAALEEFAEKGFRAASTNSIAGRAGVAKGLVFHYFGSKRALYLAVYDWIVEDMMSSMDDVLADAPDDLFERVFLISEHKLSTVQKNPTRTRFLLNNTTAPEEIREETRARALQSSAQHGMFARLLDGVDTGRLRAGVTKEEALEAIMTIREGLEKSLSRSLQSEEPNIDLTSIYARSRRLLTLLRDGLYRGE